MLVTGSISEIRNTVKLWKREKLKVGFVPTMGALHDGHLSLIRQVREHTDRVVVSIFVNPAQFGPNEDFERYPRQIEKDLKMCRKQRTAAVFIPDTSIMYPEKQFLSIQIDKLADHMCGPERPGFFEGVVLVVNKLFNIIKPDIAFFGQKDIQQFQILSSMVKEFNHEIELQMGEIVRANDGLALSSRNAYLSNEERLRAPSLYRSLQYIEKQVKSGIDEPSLLIEHQKNELEAKDFKIDYIGFFSFESLKPVQKLKSGHRYILAGAVYVGDTRLIDNLLLDYP